VKRPVLIAVLAALIASCGASASAPAPERPGVDYPLEGVVSVCDQFGHRVYRARLGSGIAVAVIPNDPSCAR
jgi:hypothetical protein